MKKTQGWLFVSLFMLGCTSEVEEVAGDGPLGSAEGALRAQNALDPNALDPNALDPNALDPNALDPNALDPNALDPGALATLQVSGEAGYLSRMLVKYLVSCAFESTQSFVFSWSDDGVVHDEEFKGSLGIAPDWATRGITLSEQRWISACVAARANLLEISIMISMRGTHPALIIESGERDSHSVQEGAFWGNIFDDVPYLESCDVTGNVSASRAEQRYCAAGLYDGATTTYCPNITRIGDCGTYCTLRADIPGDGYATCYGDEEVITTFLNPDD